MGSLWHCFTHRKIPEKIIPWLILLYYNPLSSLSYIRSMFYFVYYYIIRYYDPLSSSIDHFIPQSFTHNNHPKEPSSQGPGSSCSVPCGCGLWSWPSSEVQAWPLWTSWHLDLWMTGWFTIGWLSILSNGCEPILQWSNLWLIIVINHC